MRRLRLLVAIVSAWALMDCALVAPATGAPCAGDDNCPSGHYCELAFFGGDDGVCLPGEPGLVAALNQRAVGRNVLIVARASDAPPSGQLEVVDPDDDEITFVPRVYADLPTGIFEVDAAGAYAMSSLSVGTRSRSLCSSSSSLKRVVSPPGRARCPRT
jgi:hypothetical protein